jgi:hypothetical protein
MRKVFLLALSLGTCAAFAQERPSDFHTLTLETALQQFQATNNAAGMGLFQPGSGSQTQIEGFYRGGDDHLAQEGSPDYGFDFSTLRYDRFSDLLFMRGTFHYTLDREKERKWSDVMDPWFSVPFIYGNAVAKDYSKHNCGLTFDLYTAPLAGWISLGVRTEYEVADISGLRDPRPRTGYLNYQIVPSVLASFGPHHIGLDFGYGYSKEKLTGLTTIQSYPNLYYYKMSGLDHVDGAIGAYSGFKRQFYGPRYLADLSYNYTGDGFRALVSGGAEYGRLDAYGDKKASPGSWNYFLYNALADIQFRSGSALHQLHLSGSYKDAGADEYLQELNSEKDPVTGITTETWVTLYEYVNRYMLKQYEAALDYTLYGGCSDNDYRWSLQAGAAFNAFEKDCYLPTSTFVSDRISLSLGGSVLLVDARGHRVEAGLLATGSLPLRTEQQLQYDNEYTREVLVPDAAYYGKKRFGGSGSLTWTFPLNLGKAGLANGYVRLSGGYGKALPEGSLGNAALSVGLFTF